MWFIPENIQCNQIQFFINPSKNINKISHHSFSLLTDTTRMHYYSKQTSSIFSCFSACTLCVTEGAKLVLLFFLPFLLSSCFASVVCLSNVDDPFHGTVKESAGDSGRSWIYCIRNWLCTQCGSDIHHITVPNAKAKLTLGN